MSDIPLAPKQKAKSTFAVPTASAISASKTLSLTCSNVRHSIGELIDLNKFGPKSQKLETYLGQVLYVKSFEPSKSFLHNAERNAVTLTFDDENGDEHKIMTSAKYLVKQLFEVQAKYGFSTQSSKLSGFLGRLSATKSFGKFSHFCFIDPKDKLPPDLESLIVDS